MRGIREVSSRPDAPTDAVDGAGESDAGTAVDDLFRQHHSAVFSYALACSRDTRSAEALTSQAFTRTVRAARSADGDVSAWRPRLLVSVRRTAAGWAAGDRRDEVSPDFLQWYDAVVSRDCGEDAMLRLEESSVVLRAFRSLPERWQTALWHTAVEEEAAGKVAAVLGVAPGSVGPLASRAREGLRESYLAAYCEYGAEAGECRHYGPLLAASVHGDGRPSDDGLGRHLEGCGHCRSALAELDGLEERLSTMLPAGVLLWGGSAYVATRLAEAGTSGAKGAGGASPRPRRREWGERIKSVSIPAAVLAGSLVAATGLVVALLPLTSLTDDDAPSSPPLQVVSRPPETVIKDGPTVTSTPAPTRPGRPSGPVPELPGGQGGSTPLHLRSDRTLGAAEPSPGTVVLAGTSGNHDGRPHAPVTFVRSGVTAEYRGGGTEFDLSVDAGTKIGNGQQLRISYDLTGNGSWDRVETYRYYETDNAPGYEHYTQTRGLRPVTRGSLGDLADGRVRVEVWDAVGAGASTVGTGDTSFVSIPFD